MFHNKSPIYSFDRKLINFDQNFGELVKFGESTKFGQLTEFGKLTKFGESTRLN